MAVRGSHRTSVLKPLDGVGRDDLKSLLEVLVEGNPALAGEVNARLDRMRQTTGERVKETSAPEQGMSGEQVKDMSAVEQGVSIEQVMFIEQAMSVEQAEERLGFYKPQYEKLDSKSKTRCSWAEIENRLLAENGRYLALAEGLNRKGVLIGADKEGNPLFADSGDEPIMTNMNYPDTRNRVLYEYEGNEMVKDNGQPVLTGYELFPYKGDNEKSDEIKMYEQNTGNPIVASESRKDRRTIWLECGENPKRPCRYAYFRPDGGYVFITFDVPDYSSRDRGARRLLRVKRA